MSALSAPQALWIAVEHPRVERVGALLDRPPGGARERGVLLAHGAGADMASPFLAEVAGGLAARGFLVLRFRYPYMELAVQAGARRPPDSMERLEATHAAALARLTALCGGARPIAAGKSMGGRVGTHLAARGADLAGLALLGYPLHPPGKPERLRSEHFPAIAQPALFLQGDRDRLCELSSLRPALATFGGRATLEVVEGADHDFAVRGRVAAEVRAQLVDAVDRWDRATFPG